MMPESHPFTGIDLANGPDQTSMEIRLFTTAPFPDGDIATLHQIVTYRGEQITHRKHPPSADAELPPAYLPEKCMEYLHRAKLHIITGERKKAITELLKAGALIVAAVARLRMDEEEAQS